MPRAEKEAKVKEIAGELEGSQAAVLAGYRGLTVQDAAELRGALLEVETHFSVVKNSLAMLAVKEAGLEELTAFFDGPTALAFVKGDPVPAAKRLVEQSKRFPVIEIRGGFAEGRVLSADEVRSLAALDSREVMLAKIAGLGKMQMSKAAWMFQALQSKFLLLLEALKEKLPDEGEASAPAEGSSVADDTESPESSAASESRPSSDAEAPEAEAPAAEAPTAEDVPDAEQPPGGEDATDEAAEGPDETPAAETQTEPEAPGGPPSEETEAETEEEGGS